MSGTIRYITNKPNLEEFEGSFELGTEFVDGDEEGYGGKDVLNVPIVPDKLAICCSP